MHQKMRGYLLEINDIELITFHQFSNGKDRLIASLEEKSCRLSGKELLYGLLTIRFCLLLVQDEWFGRPHFALLGR